MNPKRIKSHGIFLKDNQYFKFFCQIDLLETLVNMPFRNFFFKKFIN